MNVDAFSGANVYAYTRNTLIFTLAVSIVANIGHTILAESVIPTWMRAGGAVIWPVLAFFAIEIIVRMLWERRLPDHVAQFALLFPGIPSIIVSYEHQRDLLFALGERGIVPYIGPIAIDGLMIGCTITLLLIRYRQSEAPVTLIAELVEPGQAEEAEEVVEEAVEPSSERRQRAPRVSNGTAPYAAVAALRDGLPVKEAARTAGMGESTTRKYAAVMRTLADSPNATIDARAAGVRQDVLDDMRAYARGQASR